MKLDRNINADGRGKYGLLLQRRREEIAQQHGGLGGLSEAVERAIGTLVSAGVIDWGDTIDSEFFLIRLKDKYADDALYRYALSATMDGEADYGREIDELAQRAGINHPNCKKPD